MCRAGRWQLPRAYQAQNLELCGKTAATVAVAAGAAATRARARGLSHLSAECRSKRFLWGGAEVREGVGCLPAQRSLHIGQDARAGEPGAAQGAATGGGQAREFRLQVATLLQVQSRQSRLSHTGGAGGATDSTSGQQSLDFQR